MKEGAKTLYHIKIYKRKHWTKSLCSKHPNALAVFLKMASAVNNN
jgi:hypothetical protein